MQGVNWLKRNEKLLPWFAGAGLAVSHIVVSSNCTVPKSGHCSSCGSCVVALTTIVAWALHKRRCGNGLYDNSNTPL